MNKEIPGFPNYEISHDGILSRGGHVLSTPISKANGYKRKYLKDLKKNLLIHRAVALAFVDNPENKREVNHKDGNKLNNHFSNLEWVTRKENAIHAS